MLIRDGLVCVVMQVNKLPVPLKWIFGFAFTRQPLWWTHLSTHAILEVGCGLWMCLCCCYESPTDP